MFFILQTDQLDAGPEGTGAPPAYGRMMMAYYQLLAVSSQLSVLRVSEARPEASGSGFEAQL